MTDHVRCRTEGHNWQPWFYAPSRDRWSRVCARWNCTGHEEIDSAGVAAGLRDPRP